MHIGALFMDEAGTPRVLKNYGRIYNELVAEDWQVEILSQALSGEQERFDFNRDMALDARILTTVWRGNTASTGSAELVRNYVSGIARLLEFCRQRAHYFVFLPSPLGSVAIPLLKITGRASSIGIYVGGDYGVERRHGKKRGALRKLLGPVVAAFVDGVTMRASLEADYCITSSHAYFTEHNKTGKVMLAPPMINTSKEDLVCLDARKRLDSELTDIVYCGELRPQKGCVDVLVAFQHLSSSREGSRLRLKVIGSGQMHEAMRQYVNKHGLTSRVVFKGTITDTDELKDELRSSLMLVLPSYSEGFPRVAYECFTLGVPTILSPVGGVPYLLSDRIHTLFVRPGDVSDIRTKMTELIRDPDMRLRLTENGLALMRDTVFPFIEDSGSLAEVIRREIRRLEDSRFVGTV